MAEFDDQQKQWLQGFVSGIEARKAADKLARRSAAGGSGGEAGQAIGPDALQHAAQDRTVAAGGKLVAEETAKRQRHPLDRWDEVVGRAGAGQFPKGVDVFLTKYQGLFYVAPAQDSFMCRLRIPNGILNAWQMRGLADAIVAHPGVVLGICGGFQMLCRRIEDTVESRCGTVEGLGLLDADIVFAGDKELRLWEVPLAGYEIHHGQVARCTEETWFEADGGAQGYVRGRVFGTHWHGLLDNDDFRRNWLMVAAVNRPGFRVAPDVSVPARRDAQLDVMADLLTAHLDLDAVLGLLDGSTPPRPTITSALDHLP